MHYDILIVGGGLVGTSLALGLHHQLETPGLTIGLVDANLDSNSRISPTVTFKNKEQIDNRSIVLSAKSLNILEALSKSTLNDFKNAPIENIHISKKGKFAITRLKASDVGLKALGYSIEITTLVETLYNRLTATPCCLIGGKFKAAKRIEKGWDVVLEVQGEAKRFSTQLLIAADGDNSLLREQAGIRNTKYEYAQSALVTTVKTEKPLCGTAFERFIPNGSIALLPLDNYSAKLVWIAPTETIETLMKTDAIEKKPST